MRLPRLLILLTAAVLGAGSLLAPAAHASATCGTTTAADEWPTFGRDATNTRTQALAGDIAPTTAPMLQPSWSFTTGTAFGGTGDLNGTPIVSGGCVYINTSTGRIIALNADSGSIVWEHDVAIPVADTGLGSGVFISSPVVDPVTHQLYALVSRSGRPTVLALDLANGTLRGEHTIIEGNGYYTQATPVLAGRVLIAGFSPVEGDPTERGGVTLFRLPSSARSSAPWHSTVVYTIPDDRFAQGYAGGGIWTAPAVDEATGYAYAGTSNPYSKQIEDRNTNAIIKIGVDPERADYGTIVGSYKGLIDQYDETVRQAADPTCAALGENDQLQEPVVGDSTFCAQLDLDFGASPNLFHDSAGRLLIGDLQKSGWYHAADAGDMSAVWKVPVGATCPACNAAAWAFDGSLMGVSSPGSTMLSISRDTGSPQWASPVADGTHYQSTSIAGGVVFTIDNYGNLLAFDEATGAPLAKRPVQLDAGGGTAPALSSAGVAIARGRVFAAAGNTVVAYAPAALPVALP